MKKLIRWIGWEIPTDMHYLILIVSIFILTYGCKKEEEKQTTIPVLITSDITDIEPVSATCGGKISSDGGGEIYAKGVCWSTLENPTIADNKTVDGKGLGIFKSSIVGISPFTTYFVRAYATNKSGTGYGNTLSFTTQDGVIDIDGNVYHTVTIGTQVWMVENLKVTHYRNGDPIPNVSDSMLWTKLSTGAYCDYNNDPENSKIYGRLYNYYAAVNPKNICPSAWHIASNQEFGTLMKYLGGQSIAAGKLKEKDTIHWSSPNVGATDIYGFCALPAGFRNYNGPFDGIGKETIMWNSNEYSLSQAYGWDINNFKEGLDLIVGPKLTGLSIRCIADN